MASQSIPIINHFVALIKLDFADKSERFVENIAQELISDLNLNVVKKISHGFHPKGTTLAFILSQSHLLIHMWPESDLLHIDLFVCRHMSEKELEESLNTVFSKQKVKSIEIKSTNFD